MSLPIDPLLFTVFGLVVLILGLKALLLGAATAATRGRIRQFLNVEDAEWLKGVHVSPDAEPIARIGRAHRNDLENLLLFASAGALYVASGASQLAGLVYCGLFLAARLLHTFAYLAARPQFRRNAYTVGFLVIAVMSIHAGAALVLLYAGGS
jgi:uncharacterized MAPEG superfamily protein